MASSAHLSLPSLLISTHLALTQRARLYKGWRSEILIGSIAKQQRREMVFTFTKLFSWILPKKELCIVMVGPYATGKTTILYKLKPGKIVPQMPTIGFNVETVEYKNINFVVWDVGAYETQRCEQPHELWKHYCLNTHGLIYVVDSNDRDSDRVVEARDKLHKMLNQDALRDVVLLVFANKQDLPNAMNAAEITDNLDLHSVRQRHWYIQGTCATSGEGLYEGLDWLSNTIANKA